MSAETSVVDIIFEKTNSGIDIMFLNVGGNLRRLKDDSEALYRIILRENPDLICLNETQCRNSAKVPNLEGYRKFFCRANDTGGRPSGGIIIFYKNYLRRKILVVSRRPEDNILFLKVHNPAGRHLYIASIYNRLPTPSFSELRSRFYRNLRSDVDKFMRDGEVFVLGDFNCRMAFLGDHDPNAIATAEFLAFKGGLEVLNPRFCFRVPTFVFEGREKKHTSIIDLALTSSLSAVSNFRILNEPLGSTRHSAHRAICLRVNFGLYAEPEERKLRKVFGLMTKDNSESFSKEASKKIISLNCRVDNILNCLELGHDVCNELKIFLMIL